VEVRRHPQRVVAHRRGGRTWEYTYDADGNLLTETDPAGVVTEYTYTAEGDVETVIDLGGDRTETNVYNAQGLITEVRQADGTSVRFEYNAAGDLTRSILPSGAATAYAYDARGNLMSSTDPIGRVTTYAYDVSNRLVSVTDPAGGVTSFTWDAGDRLASTTDAEGGVTTYAYDGDGQLVSATDPMGGVTGYEWDALARLVTVTDPAGGASMFAYDREDNLVATTDPKDGTTAFLLDEAYRTVGVVDPNGGEWERRYDETGVQTASVDPLGAETTSTLDDLGRAVSTTDATDASSSVEYDAAGRLVSQTDAAGGVTIYEYDLMDRVTLVTDPAGFETEYLYDIDGNLIGVVDRNGNPTLYEVDAAGQVLRETDATGAVTEFSYDPAGRITSILDADGRTTAIEYDRNGQQTAIVAPGGARTTYAYDAAGRLVSQTDALGAVTTYAYDKASRLVTATDAAGGVSTYGYDKAGRQTLAVDPVGEATAFAYDKAGQLVGVTEGYEAGADAAADVNVKTAYAYTATGLLEKITNPLGAETTFAYDAAGRQTTETGPTGIETVTTYDDAGRVARVSNPAGLVAAYTYDERSDVAKLTRADGDVSFEYSGEQQPIVMDDPTGTTGWVYDEVGRLLEQTDTRGDTLTSTYTAAGLRESLTYPDGTQTAYTFDAAGDVATQSTPEGVVEYAWDAESRLVGITRPNQVTSSFEYDALGQVTRVRHETPESESVPVAEPAPGPLLTDAVECRAVGSYLAERQAPMAGGQKPCVKTWDYLERRTLPEVESPVPAGASLEYTYEYDAAGSVTDSVRTITGPAVPELDEGSPVDGPDAPSTPEPRTVSEPGTVPELDEGPAPTTQTVDTLTQAFAYDNLGRLTRSEASDGETNSYGYDAAGNRTSWNINGAEAGSSQLTAEFNAAGQLTSTTTTGANAGSATYTFDGAGNRSGQTVNGTQTSFHHDPAGRLQSTQTEGRSTSYSYDGLDRRTSVTDDTTFGSDTTSTTWDGLTPVATDSAQHGVTDLLRDPTGEVVFQSGAYDDVWALGDMRNVTATADAAGQITDLVDYTDFGAAGFESTGWASLVGNDGQPGDATLGLDHYYARDYDAATGSWVQPDEWRGLLVRPQSLNRFAYVENSPVAFRDHLGFWAKNARKKTVGGAVADAMRKAAVRASLNSSASLTWNRLNGTPSPASQAPIGIRKPTVVTSGPPWLRSEEYLSQRHTGPELTTGQAQALADRIGPLLEYQRCADFPTTRIPCGPEYGQAYDATVRGALESADVAMGIIPLFRTLRILRTATIFGEVGGGGPGSPGSIKGLSDSYVKRVLREIDTEPHAFKAEYVGTQNVSKFNIKMGSNGELLLVSIKDSSVIIRTGVFP
jgi:RHS repeat-associated protein